MEIYLQLDGTQAGPFTEEQVRDMLRSGAVKPADYAWHDGLEDWKQLKQVMPPKGGSAGPAPVDAPEVKQSVHIPVLAILAFILAAVGGRCWIWIHFHMHDAGSADSYQFWGLAGISLIDVFFILAIITWIAWLVCWKSRGAVNIVFCVAVCALELVIWNSERHAAAGMNKLAQARKDADSSIRGNLNDPTKGLAVARQALFRYSQDLASASNDLRGNDKLEAEAGENYSKLLGAQLQKYAEAYQALNEAGFIQPQGINTKEDLQHRRDLAKAFADANGQLADFYRNSKETMRKELQQENLNDSFIDSVLKDFDQSTNVDAALQIRQLEENLVDQANKIFDIYDREWGKWSLDPQGAILFKDTAAYVDYDNALGAIKQITRQQKAIQAQALRHTAATGTPQ